MEVTVFHIIKMNLIAGIFVLLVTVVSKCLGRRYSARWKYWCWLILAVFLLIPVDFSVIFQWFRWGFRRQVLK